MNGCWTKHSGWSVTVQAPESPLPASPRQKEPCALFEETVPRDFCFFIKLIHPSTCTWRISIFGFFQKDAEIPVVSWTTLKHRRDMKERS
jgi:hypothetical protein